MEETVSQLIATKVPEPYRLRDTLVWMISKGRHDWAIELLDATRPTCITKSDTQVCMQIEAELHRVQGKPTLALDMLLAAYELDHTSWPTAHATILELRRQDHHLHALDILDTCLELAAAGNRRLQTAYCSIFREYIITAESGGLTKLAEYRTSVV